MLLVLKAIVVVNLLVKKYYQIGLDPLLQEVIFLSQDKSCLWDEISQKIPDLPKSWFELSRVHPLERIEFVKLLWQDLLPFHLKFSPYLESFFAKLDDIGIVVAKRGGEYFPEMVYSFSDNSTFFIGNPPATFDDVRYFISQLGFSLPQDFLSFLILHNGFGRLGSSGILSMDDVDSERQKVRKMLMGNNFVIDHRGGVVNPQSLIPFYVDSGLNSYQCFYVDWSPMGEIGNVYLSGLNSSISDISKSFDLSDELAFASFSEWFMQFLEGISFSK